jgi:hypothetical protein
MMSAQVSAKKESKVADIRKKSAMIERCERGDQEYLRNILDSHLFDYEREANQRGPKQEFYERIEKSAYGETRRQLKFY